jgi:hypothetical protein
MRSSRSLSSSLNLPTSLGVFVRRTREEAALQQLLPFGRKTGERWVTEPMRERARAEAHRLGAKRFTLDKALVLALFGSAKGNHVRQAKAMAMLDAHERAAVERERQSPPTEARLRSVQADLRAALRASPWGHR